MAGEPVTICCIAPVHSHISFAGKPKVWRHKQSRGYCTVIIGKSWNISCHKKPEMNTAKSVWKYLFWKDHTACKINIFPSPKISFHYWNPSKHNVSLFLHVFLDKVHCALISYQFSITICTSTSTLT